jgi:hypothetical protein
MNILMHSLVAKGGTFIEYCYITRNRMQNQKIKSILILFFPPNHRCEYGQFGWYNDGLGSIPSWGKSFLFSGTQTVPRVKCWAVKLPVTLPNAKVKNEGAIPPLPYTSLPHLIIGSDTNQ